MNAANVMAISPKAGAVNKVQLTRNVGKGGMTSPELTKDSFGEALGKAGEEVTGKMAKSPTEAQGSVQGNVDAKEADIKDDMPEGTEAALTEQQGKEPRAGKAPKDGKETQGAEAKEGVEEAGNPELGKLAAQAAVLNFSPEGQAALVMEEIPPQAETAATVNLQSLLPQSTEEVQKNKNFLAMLSGQQVKVAAKETASENIPLNLVQNQQGNQQNNPLAVKPATMLEAQLSNHQLANQMTENIEGPLMGEQPETPILTVLNDGRERLDAKGMAPFEQSEETMPSMPAGRVNDSVTLQQVMGRAAIPEGAAPPPCREDEGQPVKNPLAGVTVTVEEEIPVTPNMNLQQNPRQGDWTQQNQPQAPVMEIVEAEDGEAVTQLAEEAVGDKAPKNQTSQSANNESISMFQQSLDESLTGAKAADDVSQPQNVRDEFNVTRQIVDQARLLRRGEDTQMVIKLHPDHLGELTLKVSVSANGAVSASFHSDNAQVRTIIENTLVQLKQELNNQGLKVDNVDVYAGLTDGQLPQGEGQQAWQQNQSGSSNNVRNIGNVEDYGEETENIAAVASEITEAAEGVDYRI